jgi:type IV pilus assembly protein PilE
VKPQSFRTRSTQNAAPGFSLIELMIAVTIVAILASIALPSYRSYVTRGNRAAAQAEMMSLANREQQFLLANRAYADKAALTASGYVLPLEVSRFYNWDVTAEATPVPAFTITLTPIGSQARDGALTLDNRGNKTPAEKWR